VQRWIGEEAFGGGGGGAALCPGPLLIPSRQGVVKSR